MFQVKRIDPDFYKESEKYNGQVNAGMWLHGGWLDKPDFKDDAETLYFGWAIEHLITLNQAIMMISSHSNLNMIDSQAALLEEKRKLIIGNPNYWEAETLLQKIGLQLGARIVQEDDE